MCSSDLQPESRSSLEDDKMLQKVPLVSINAKNKVSVQSGARIQEKEKHASKEDTKFSMGQCWFQNGKLVWRENLVEIRRKYMAHLSKILHEDSWQGESYFQYPLKLDHCRNNMYSANFSCCSTNFKNFHHDFVKASNGRSVDSRNNLSFSEKLNLMKSGIFQWFKVGRVENQYPHLHFL